MKHAPRIAAESFTASFALTEADESAGTFRGMASVFGAPIDTYPPSIIERGAFTKTLAEQGQRVKILWQHDVSEPIGKPVSLRETDSGLEMVGRLDPIELGIRAMKQIKSGTLTDLSIGFDPVKWDMVRDAHGTESTRCLKEVRLWEVSVVTFGAQKAATMNAFAMAFRDLPLGALKQAWEPEAAAARVETWAAGDQERLYRAYLAGGSDSCRFQIADVVDGRLVVIPQAVFAAAVALSVDSELPQRVAEYSKEHLAAYYHKMGRIAPWEEFRTARVLVEPIASLPAEAFEGRVLSTKNKALVEEAVKVLSSLLDSAGKGKEITDEQIEDVAEVAAAIVETKVDEPVKDDPAQSLGAVLLAEMTSGEASRPEVSEVYQATTAPVETLAAPAESVAAVDMRLIELRLREMEMAQYASSIRTQ